MARYIITSALPYVNGVKHLGNMIGSLLPADIFARYLRQQGEDVLAVCGTDEHGTACEISALEAKMPVAEYAAKFHEIQKDIYRRFGLSFDWFGRTSSPQNRRMTQHLFKRLHANGFIEERSCQQVYCLDCKRFLSDRFVLGTCPKCGYEMARGDQCEACTTLLDPGDLKSPRCAVCKGSNLETRQSKHLYLALPKAADRVAKWVESKEGRWSRSALGVAHKWLAEGLRERCITRDLEWGIPVPLPGYESKVFYVWFDAPIGYIGISMEWAEAKGDPDAWQKYWKDPSTSLVQFMAKDNVPFHTVTWPATMMGADDGFVLADMIKGFEYLNYEGKKFSTSQKVGVFTDQALELFPPDVWRYCLCSLAPEKRDTDFTWESFEAALNKDLADTLGNFVNRAITFVTRYFGGKVPPAQPDGAEEKAVKDALATALKDGVEAMAEYSLGKATRAGRDFWAACNKYFDARAPWTQRKTDLAAAGSTLNCAVHLARSAAIMAAPFIPFTAERIFEQLGLDPASVHKLKWQAALDFGCLDGKLIGPAAPLFQKVEAKTLAELRERFAGK